MPVSAPAARGSQDVRSCNLVVTFQLNFVLKIRDNVDQERERERERERGRDVLHEWQRILSEHLAQNLIKEAAAAVSPMTRRSSQPRK